MELKILALEKIVEDPDQPRKVLDDATLAGLADSIRQHGLLNPITVTPLAGVEGYRIVTGERRWRASQLAGLFEIPCVVAEPAEDTASRVSEQLVENLQREDLAPLDKARAIQTLKETLAATNREVSQRLGVSERTVGYLLDLLGLPEAIGEQIVNVGPRPAEGQLTEKHGRFLKQLNDQPDLQAHLVEKIRGEKLSADDAGKVVKAIREHPDKAEALLGGKFEEIPSILGISREEAPSFSVGGAFLKQLDRIPGILDEIKLEKASMADLPSIEGKLIAARESLDRKLAEVRAALG
jgi:ParB family transcriptional regulator, chromosome partitioning protein